MTDAPIGTGKRMTKREARRWVQLHWATFMQSADPPYPCPPEVADLWTAESARMASRIATLDETTEWRARNHA